VIVKRVLLLAKLKKLVLYNPTEFIKEVKTKVILKAVLDKYGVELKRAGKSHAGNSPIHGQLWWLP